MAAWNSFNSICTTALHSYICTTALHSYIWTTALHSYIYHGSPGLKLGTLNWIIYICTRALHSFLSFEHCHAASTIIDLSPKATFTPSIQPNLGQPGLELHYFRNAINKQTGNNVSKLTCHAPRNAYRGLARSRGGGRGMHTTLQLRGTRPIQLRRRKLAQYWKIKKRNINYRK